MCAGIADNRSLLVPPAPLLVEAGRQRWGSGHPSIACYSQHRATQQLWGRVFPGLMRGKHGGGDGCWRGRGGAVRARVRGAAPWRCRGGPRVCGARGNDVDEGVERGGLGGAFHDLECPQITAERCTSGWPRLRACAADALHIPSSIHIVTSPLAISPALYCAQFLTRYVALGSACLWVSLRMFPAKIENLRRNPVCLQRYRHVVARKRQHGLTTTLIYATTPRRSTPSTASRN